MSEGSILNKLKGFILITATLCLLISGIAYSNPMKLFKSVIFIHPSIVKSEAISLHMTD